MQPTAPRPSNPWAFFLALAAITGLASLWIGTPCRVDPPLPAIGERDQEPYLEPWDEPSPPPRIVFPDEPVEEPAPWSELPVLSDD